MAAEPETTVWDFLLGIASMILAVFFLATFLVFAAGVFVAAIVIIAIVCVVATGLHLCGVDIRALLDRW